MSKVIKKPEISMKQGEKFETFLFLPRNSNLERFGEGGLRKKNIYKNSESNKPLISIVTTNLNGNIERTILSVIDQKYSTMHLR